MIDLDKIWFFIGPLIVWMGWVTKRLSGSMSREEHADVCKNLNEQRQASNQRVLDQLDNQDKTIDNMRLDVRVIMGQIATLEERSRRGDSN